MIKKQLLILLILLSSLAGYSQTISPQFKTLVNGVQEFHTGNKTPTPGYDSLMYMFFLRNVFKNKADSVNNNGYVTHGYLNSHGSSYSFQNGLTNYGSFVGQGGALNQNTTVDISGYEYNLGDQTTGYTGIDIKSLDGIVSINGGLPFGADRGFSQINLTRNQALFRFQLLHSPGGYGSFDIEPGFIKLDDHLNSKGAEYADDYSTNQLADTAGLLIPSIKTVKSLIGSLAPSTATVNGKADTGLYIKRTVGVIHLKTIPQLIAYSGLATDIFVEDQRTGGLFTYNSAVAVADSGLTQYATGKGVGLWQRKINPGEPVNVGWYTYIKGDDIANDGPAIERLINVVGQTKLTFPDNDVYYGSVNIRKSNVNLLMGKNTIFDGQVFHVIGGGVVDSLAYNPIQNIQITGGIKLTGRFGTFYVKNLYVDKVEIVADSSIYAYQTFAGGSRGVHLYNGTQNSYIGQIITRSTKFNALSGALVTDCTQTTDQEQNKNNYIGSVIVESSKSNGWFSSKTKNNYIPNVVVKAFGQGNFAQSNGVGLVNDDGLHVGIITVDGTKTPYSLNNGIFIAGTNNVTIDHAISQHNPYKGIQIPEYGNGLRNKNLQIGTLLATNNGTHGAQIFGEVEFGTLTVYGNDTLAVANTPNMSVNNSRSFIVNNYLQPVKQTNINSAVFTASKNINIKNLYVNGSSTIGITLVNDTLTNFGRFYVKNATEALRYTNTRFLNVDDFKSDSLSTREIGNISGKAVSIAYDPGVRFNTNPHIDSAFYPKKMWYRDSISLFTAGLQKYKGDMFFRPDGIKNGNWGWFITADGTAITAIAPMHETSPRFTAIYAGTSITDAGLTSAGIVTNTSAGLLGTVGVTGSGTVVESVSPALTGTPTVPTATAGTNNTQAASTAFVTAAVSAGSGTGTLTNTHTMGYGFLGGNYNNSAPITSTLDTAGAAKSKAGFLIDYNNLKSAIGLKVAYADTAAAFANLLHKALNETFTGVKTGQKNALGVTTTDILYLNNSTPAALNAQQISPSLHIGSPGWGTTAGTSQSTDWQINNLPVQGTVPTSNLQFNSSIAGVAYVNKATLSSAGLLTTTGGVTTVGSGTFGALTTTGNFQQQSTGLTNTVTSKVFASNTTAATVGAQVQNSPGNELDFNAWATGTGVSNNMAFQTYAVATPGATAGGAYTIRYKNNTLSTFADIFSLDASGNITNTGLDNYSVDQSANYTARSKVDKGYVTGLLAPALVQNSASTLTIAFGADYEFQGTTATWTLPTNVSTATGRAYQITIKNTGSGNLTVNGAIYDGSVVTTITIAPGGSVTLMPSPTRFLKE